jgi:hypothetical protein
MRALGYAGLLLSLLMGTSAEARGPGKDVTQAYQQCVQDLRDFMVQHDRDAFNKYFLIGEGGDVAMILKGTNNYWIGKFGTDETATGVMIGAIPAPDPKALKITFWAPKLLGQDEDAVGTIQWFCEPRSSGTTLGGATSGKSSPMVGTSSPSPIYAESNSGQSAEVRDFVARAYVEATRAANNKKSQLNSCIRIPDPALQKIINVAGSATAAGVVPGN